MERGLFLRAALEGGLRESVDDSLVAGTVAGQAVHIAEHGGSSASLWKEDGAGVEPLRPVGEEEEGFRSSGSLVGQANGAVPTGSERPVGRYPAITVPVQITGEEHERIAGFCEANRITLAEFITLRGVGFEMKDFTDDPLNRAGLVEQITERFGGSWPVEPNSETRVVTVEFSRQAFAWLEAMTYYDGFATPADRIRASMAGDVASLTEALHEDEIKRIFGAPTGEERDLMLVTSRAANRDDLPLAAAAKPTPPSPRV